MRSNPEFFVSKSPTDKLDLSGSPWPDEVKGNFDKLNRDPQLRLLIGPAIPKLVDRALHAPRRRGPGWVKASGVGRNLVQHPDEDQWLVDVDTGETYLFEEDGRWRQAGWWKQVRPPDGAFTYGEMMLLDYELTRALERLAVAAEAGALNAKQRRLAGVELGEAAENVGLRLHIYNIHTTPEEAKALKRSILEFIARDENPRLRRMMNPRNY